MAAGGQRGPDHAVAVDIHAARIEARLRDFEQLRLAGGRRVVAALQPYEIAGKLFADAPDAIVDRTRDDRVHRVADHRSELGSEGQRRAAASCACTASGRVALVERGIAAAVEDIPRPGDPAVAVGVEYLAAPAHSLLLVLGLVDLRINPAEDRTEQLGTPSRRGRCRTADDASSSTCR